MQCLSHSHVNSGILCHYLGFIVEQCIRQKHFLIRGMLNMSLLNLSLFYQRSHQRMLWLGKVDSVWGWNESYRSMVFLWKHLADFPPEVLVYHPEALRLFSLYSPLIYSLSYFFSQFLPTTLLLPQTTSLLFPFRKRQASQGYKPDISSCTKTGHLPF